MSQENVETFMRAVEAINRGDVETVLQELDPAIEWHMAIQELVGGVAGVYHGHDGVREYFRDMDDAFAEVELDYTEVRDLGDRVLATGSFRTRGRHSGAVIESPVAALVDVDDDSKATRVLTYLDLKEALEAAGLRDG
jgi:ketosteroid isomerase-like protein